MMISFWKAVIFVIFFSSAAAGAGLWYRRKLRRQLEHVLQELDHAISGEKGEEIYDESIDAAIQERLNRLLENSRMKFHTADREKNTVKALISDISHQVRTPLSNIMLYGELLREQELDQESRNMADQIYAQTQKLDFFMRELVRSSYLETEMIAIDMQEQSVEDLIRKSCQDLEVRALKKGIVLQISETESRAVYDMKWTREALGNLLDNAVKYSPEGSSVSIWTEEYESFIRIHIRDQGMGIQEEELPKIFLRFYRSSEALKEKGLGIGLYLAREILKKEGGYIKVISRPGQGSDFSVFLPRRMEMCQNCQI